MNMCTEDEGELGEKNSRSTGKVRKEFVSEVALDVF